MKRADYVFLAILLTLAIFIWVRDLAWVSIADDTLPILVALPLFFWMGMPWAFNEGTLKCSQGGIAASAAFFVLGIAFNLTLLLAIGWTLLLWTWLKARMPSEKLPSLQKLLVLPILAFPWISLDLDRIGWWFRLTGAWVTAQLFHFLGFEVSQEGTNLLINKLPLSVEAACAGLNTLQSMLIAGSILDYIILGQTSLYWINLPVIILMAWVTNTVRIIVISIAALAVNPEFALGAFHTIGGWLVIMLMFGLCWIIFSQQEPVAKPLEPKL